MQHYSGLKILLLTLLLQTFLIKESIAQAPDIEKLRRAVTEHPQQDTVRVNRLNVLAIESRKNTPAESYSSAIEALELARQLNYTYGEGIATLTLGFYYRFHSESKEALKYTQKAFEIFRQLSDTIQQITCLYNLAYINSVMGKHAECISHSFDALRMAQTVKSQKWLVLVNTQLGNTFLNLGDDTKGRQYLIAALKIAESTGDKDGIIHCIDGLGYLCEKDEKWDEALKYYETGMQLAIQSNDRRGITKQKLNIADLKEKQGFYKEAFPLVFQYLDESHKRDSSEKTASYAHSILARAHLHTGQFDSAIYYGKLSLRQNQSLGRKASSGYISQILAEAYAKTGKFTEAYHYQLLYASYRDSMNERENIQRASGLQYGFDLDKKQSEISLLTKNQELIRKQNSQQKYLLIGSLIVILLVAALSLFLWRNNKQKQMAYSKLQQQQDELKSTQSQLIQSEKMASLGELTAGIAHEIQNPLNFVNNFSEVSTELIDEMNVEIEKGNIEEAKEIAGDLKQNLEKINHHGKRAGDIVKGMLQHSRSSSGVKEPTNINALADEYLRLAYHGLRAKDKSFNATIKTDFDESIGNINIIPQDIGRVILNLITNAFYVVDEKKKSGIGNYEPTVSVSTKKEDNKVFISVNDNGNGIPQKILDKIFQPFFTTKPTGQGTGLGLSLSYDIVKAHGGELRVETTEGEGSTFTLQLPTN